MAAVPCPTCLPEPLESDFETASLAPSMRARGTSFVVVDSNGFEDSEGDGVIWRGMPRSDAGDAATTVQFEKLHSALESGLDRVVKRVLRGLHEELDSRSDMLRDSTGSRPVDLERIERSTHTAATLGVQSVVTGKSTGRPQTAGLVVMHGKSTSSFGSDAHSLEDHDPFHHGITIEPKLVPTPEGMDPTVSFNFAMTDDDMTMLFKHRRGYLAGRQRQKAYEAHNMHLAHSTSKEETFAVMKSSTKEMSLDPIVEEETGWLSWFVGSCYFQYLSTFVIAVSVFVLGMQTDYLARHLEEPTGRIYDTLEGIVCILFILEIGLRVWHAGIKQFVFGETWKWNMFDSGIVVVQLVEESLDLIRNNWMRKGSDDEHRMMLIVRTLRLLRFARIIRILRALRSVSELRTIIVSIFGTFRNLMWTLILLFLNIFVVAVTITQIVAYHCMSESDEEKIKALQKHFGNLAQSCLVLFQTITNGIDWDQMLQPLTDYISPWMALPVCVYIGFGVFALMNIVTGVFVESALESVRREKERFLLHTVKNLFANTDVDGSGDISWLEFQGKLDDPAMRQYFKAIDLDLNEAEDLFHLIDVDGSGSIDPEEFVNGCLRLQGPAKALDLATFMHEYKRSSKNIKTQLRKVIVDVSKAKHMSQDLIRHMGS